MGINPPSHQGPNPFLLTLLKICEEMQKSCSASKRQVRNRQSLTKDAHPTHCKFITTKHFFGSTAMACGWNNGIKAHVKASKGMDSNSNLVKKDVGFTEEAAPAHLQLRV